MLRSRLLFFVVAAVSMAGCSKKNARASDSGESVAPTQTISDRPTQDSGRPTENSEGVPGYLLTFACADFDPLVTIVEATAAMRVLGCIFKQDGERVAAASLANVKAKVVLKDGRELEVDPRLSSESDGWSIVFTLPTALRPSVARVETTGDYRDQGFTAAAPDTAYATAGDPAFGEAWGRKAGMVLFELLRVTHVPGSCAIPEDFDDGGVEHSYPFDASKVAAAKFHIAFIPDELVRGDIGLAGADAVCAKAGQLIGDKLTFKAILGTSTQSAEGRIPLAGPVFSTFGFLVAESPEDFWKPVAGAIPTGAQPLGRYQLPATAEQSFKGHHTMLGNECGLDNRSLHNRKLPWSTEQLRIWTGSTADAAVAASATCKDWTSAGGADTGATGRQASTDEHFFDKDGNVLACNQKAFLYCISL